MINAIVACVGGGTMDKDFLNFFFLLRKVAIALYYIKECIAEISACKESRIQSGGVIKPHPINIFVHSNGC